MAEKNYEARLFETWGPKCRFDVNNPDNGVDGKSVYQLYAFNDDNDVHLETFNESGAYRIINDRGIEIAGGAKGSDGNVDICNLFGLIHNQLEDLIFLQYIFVTNL